MSLHTGHRQRRLGRRLARWGDCNPSRGRLHREAGSPHPSPASELAEKRWLLRQVVLRAQNLVYQPVRHGLVGLEVLCAHRVGGDLLERLSCLLREQLVDRVARLEHFGRLDLYVRRLSTRLRARLREHDGGVRQAGALALDAVGEQHRRRAECGADADRLDLGAHVVHRVSNRKRLGLKRDARGAHRIDVHVDGLLSRLVVEEEQLCHNQLRYRRNQRRPNVDNPVVQQQ
mmetsp:Transcript_1693/g.5120  ORF Transcript_1693/g.5120 Transcript_1693/m.5120 type:complete len:231 (+) Transcript_1693:122-814(+)